MYLFIYPLQAIEEYKNKGNEEHKKEHYHKALVQYNMAIRISRYDPVLYGNRSMAFLNMKKFNHAVIDAKRALNLNPYWSKVSIVRRYKSEDFEALHGGCIVGVRFAVAPCKQSHSCCNKAPSQNYSGIT